MCTLLENPQKKCALLKFFKIESTPFAMSTPGSARALCARECTPRPADGGALSGLREGCRQPYASISSRVAVTGPAPASPGPASPGDIALAVHFLIVPELVELLSMARNVCGKVSFSQPDIS